MSLEDDPMYAQLQREKERLLVPKLQPIYPSLCLLSLLESPPDCYYIQVAFNSPRLGKAREVVSDLAKTCTGRMLSSEPSSARAQGEPRIRRRRSSGKQSGALLGPVHKSFPRRPGNHKNRKPLKP